MSDKIKAGMYDGDNPVGRPISLNPNIVKIKHDDGTYVELPSIEYVNRLENQILALQKQHDRIAAENKSNSALISRLAAALKKIESKFR